MLLYIICKFIVWLRRVGEYNSCSVPDSQDIKLTEYFRQVVFLSYNEVGFFHTEYFILSMRIFLFVHRSVYVPTACYLSFLGQETNES